MAKAVKCPICGQKFEKSNPNQRYCSLICRESARRLARVNWEVLHPQYNAEYMRKYRAEKREAKA